MNSGAYVHCSLVEEWAGQAGPYAWSALSSHLGWAANLHKQNTKLINKIYISKIIDFLYLCIIKLTKLIEFIQFQTFLTPLKTISLFEFFVYPTYGIASVTYAM